MPTIRIQISVYELSLAREAQPQDAPTHHNQGPRWSYRLSLSSQVRGEPSAVVYFARTDASRLQSAFLAGQNRFVIFLPEEHFGDWISVLRNEEPLYFVADTDAPEGAMVQTGLEPVGEAEELCCDDQGTAGPPPAGAGGETPAVDTPPRAVPIVPSWRPFEEKATGHSLVNAYLLARASYDIYADEAPAGQTFQDYFESTYRPWLEDGSSTPAAFDFIDTGDVLPLTGLQAAVMSNDRFVVATFRGTQITTGDWGTNLGVVWAPVDLEKLHLGVAHGGWTLRLNNVYPALLKVLENHSNGFQKPVWLTGHSVGAAQSTLLAQRLVADGRPVQGVVTFGEPPLADAIFLSAYTLSGLGSRTERWVHGSDIVTWLVYPLLAPIPSPLTPSVTALHPTVLFQFIENDPESEEPGVLHDQTFMWPSLPLSEQADHSVVTYARKLHLNLSDPLKGMDPDPLQGQVPDPPSHP